MSLFTSVKIFSNKIASGVHSNYHHYTLPDDRRDPAVSTSTFGQSLKTSVLCLSARLAH